MNFKTRLRMLRRDKGLSQTQLGNVLGLSTSTISMYENGNREPDFETLELIADYFNVDIGFILGKSDTITRVKEQSFNISKFPNIKPVRYKKVPLLGEIACGEPIYANEERGAFVDCDEDIPADFCLKAHGDSMIGARIYDGDIVFVMKQSIVDNGEIAVVVIDDEATLKRLYFYPDEQMLSLRPENPAFEEIIYRGKELENVVILGKVIACQFDVK
ncbi:MAG: helix-turn-helix domain-containing protein [Clostridiales bacterium]|nr:helix-turn-helix domain-containing protein [Clostridiales bacterium]